MITSAPVGRNGAGERGSASLIVASHNAAAEAGSGIGSIGSKIIAQSLGNRRVAMGVVPVLW